MVNRRTFKEFLIETPVTDYKTFGNFNKGSSFRYPEDRKMVTAEKAVRNTYRKLGRTSYNLNLYFVNAPNMGRHLETGRVDEEWVVQNLPPEVIKHFHANAGLVENAVNIIYTNNRGDERVPMTSWTMVHRLFHALEATDRKEGWGHYKEADKHLHDQVSQIMSYYGKQNFKSKDKYLRTSDSNIKRDQLAFKYLFHAIGTFKSARDKNIRDYFEVINELGAQLIVTNRITFHPAPRCFEGGARGSRQSFCAREEDMDDLNNHIQMLARDMEIMIGDILNSAVGSIYVM